MNEVILFLLESSLILGVLYLLYYLLLRKEVSFNFNRFYLLGTLIITFCLPLLRVDFNLVSGGHIDQPISKLNYVRISYQEAVKEWTSHAIDQDFSSFSIMDEKEMRDPNLPTQLVFIVYSIGLAIMTFRLIWMISWVSKLKSRHSKIAIAGVQVVKVPFQIAPFSFLNSVFVYEEILGSEEFTHILEHEKTHIRQRHSIDLLIVQLLTALFWFNPVIWWLNTSLKTTHEYIADRKMIKQGYSLVEYQSLLLRQLISNNSFGLVHNFNLSFIKKRITMMNIQKLDNLGKFKVISVITISILFTLIIIQCNSKLKDQELVLAEEFSANLPIIQHTDYSIDISEEHINVVIKDDQLFVNQKQLSLEELKNLKGDFHTKTQVVMEVDKDQKMKLVHEVQEVLRQRDLRMLIYVGLDQEGQILNTPLMLPPSSNSNSGIMVPELTEEFIEENGIIVLELDMGLEDVSYNKLVYNYLKDPLIDRSSLVVRGNYKDEDTYGVYLASLNNLKQGYYDFYEERTQELYGKSFYDIDREQKTSEEAKQKYREVRKGVPMAITFVKI